MKDFILPLLFAVAIVIAKAATAFNPVTVDLTSPTDGQTISGTNVTFTARAASLVTNVVRVELYETHTWTNPTTHQVFTTTNLVGTMRPKPGTVQNSSFY